MKQSRVGSPVTSEDYFSMAESNDKINNLANNEIKLTGEQKARFDKAADASISMGDISK